LFSSKFLFTLQCESQEIINLLMQGELPNLFLLSSS
jgi:hypothetical protein